MLKIEIDHPYREHNSEEIQQWLNGAAKAHYTEAPGMLVFKPGLPEPITPMFAAHLVADWDINNGETVLTSIGPAPIHYMAHLSKNETLLRESHETVMAELMHRIEMSWTNVGLFPKYMGMAMQHDSLYGLDPMTQATKDFYYENNVNTVSRHASGMLEVKGQKTTDGLPVGALRVLARHMWMLGCAVRHAHVDFALDDDKHRAYFQATVSETMLTMAGRDIIDDQHLELFTLEACPNSYMFALVANKRDGGIMDVAAPSVIAIYTGNPEGMILICPHKTADALVRVFPQSFANLE